MPYANIIFLLNKKIEDVGLSPRAIEGLKAAGFNRLSEFRAAVIADSAPLKTLGFKSRLEIGELFEKNKVTLPTRWVWRK